MLLLLLLPWTALPLLERGGLGTTVGEEDDGTAVDGDDAAAGFTFTGDFPTVETAGAADVDTGAAAAGAADAAAADVADDDAGAA